MAIGRPFLITLLAGGYIVNAIIDVLVGIGVLDQRYLSAFISGSTSTIIVLGLLQLIFGLSLFKGTWWSWWFVVIGAYIPIISHIIGGIRGESWGWGTILWNIAVLSYMQSRDIKTFFGRETYF